MIPAHNPHQTLIFYVLLAAFALLLAASETKYEILLIQVSIQPNIDQTEHVTRSNQAAKNALFLCIEILRSPKWQ